MKISLNRFSYKRCREDKRKIENKNGIELMEVSNPIHTTSASSDMDSVGSSSRLAIDCNDDDNDQQKMTVSVEHEALPTKKNRNARQMICNLFFIKCMKKKGEYEFDDTIATINNEPKTDCDGKSNIEDLVMSCLDAGFNLDEKKVLDKLSKNEQELEHLKKQQYEISNIQDNQGSRNHIIGSNFEPTFNESGKLISDDVPITYWLNTDFVERILEENKYNYWEIPNSFGLRERYLPLAINKYGLHK